MDNSIQEKMASKIPHARVLINKTVAMQRIGITSWMGFVGLVTVGYFLYQGNRIGSVYRNYPTQRVFKGYPDYVNGSVYFYERDVKRVIKDL